jgi:multiple sugar transport system permease protein
MSFCDYDILRPAKWIGLENCKYMLAEDDLKLLNVHGPNWLGSQVWSKPSFIVMRLWSAGGGMLIWLAGLKDISEQYYEAAAIDGASRTQQFRHITLPLLNAFRYGHMGYASAMAWVLFIIILILTILQLKSAKHWVHYGGE